MDVKNCVQTAARTGFTACADVSVIPATKRSVRSGAVLRAVKNLRVAAYCRVSTGNDEQQSSYIKQKEYYTKLINTKDGWQMAGIYADEATTGTSRIHRKEFNRMIDDALHGKIDYIVTKSISRFARNTVDTLECVRQLRQLSPPVGIYFEKENIDTLDSAGELFLTILSAMAQDESRSISDNVRWSLQKNFQQGKPTINLKRMLGYDPGENGEWIINEEQAETVREIFNLYLCGLSAYKVALAMNEKKHYTVNGNKWSSSSILNILQNEKYAGDLEMQKNVTVDMLTHTVKKNTGEAPKYYIKNHHVAIIRREIWEQVQIMIRLNSQKPMKPKASHFGDIFCGIVRHKKRCGNKYQRFKYCSKARDYSDDRCLKAQSLPATDYKEGYFFNYAVWRCSANLRSNRIDGNKVCPSDFLYECAMEQSFMEMIYRIKNDIELNGEHAEIYRSFGKLSDIKHPQTDIRSDIRIEEINKRICEIKKNIKFIKAENNCSLYPVLTGFQKQIKELRQERSVLLQSTERQNANKESFDYFIKRILALPTTMPDGTKMNINTVTTEYENKSENNDPDTSGHSILTAPDYLYFDRYFYRTFIKNGIVYGDEIEYTTCFGLKLKSTGNRRTIKSFLGFRKYDKGEYHLLKYTWQVINKPIQYRRKKKE